jgi:6-methylsalicylate decarboxylase
VPVPVPVLATRRLRYDLAGRTNATQLSALGTISRPDHLLYRGDYAWTPAEVVVDALTQLDGLAPDVEKRTWRKQITLNARALLCP